MAGLTQLTQLVQFRFYSGASGHPNSLSVIVNFMTNTHANCTHKSEVPRQSALAIWYRVIDWPEAPFPTPLREPF